MRILRSSLSIFDFIRFSWQLSECDRKQRTKLTNKHSYLISTLRRDRFGAASNNYDTIINLTGVTLTQIEKEVLCGGVDFGILPRFNRLDILAEFEFLQQQLSSIPAKSDESAVSCRASLAAEAYRFAESPPDTRSFSLTREHLNTVNEFACRVGKAF